MVRTPTQEARDYIEDLADELDISDTRYEQAEESYTSLGRWLSRNASRLSEYTPAVYIQGSFAYGTVIKPFSETEDYDIDAVCELKTLTKAEMSQADLKELLRVEMGSYRRAQKMLKPLHEGRRCWTLKYSDGAQFHLDVVPAVPNAITFRKLLEANQENASLAGTAIAITDNEHDAYHYLSDDWPRSNPKGYLAWFKTRMEAEFRRRREILAETLRKSVEEIPEYRVRTPLQSAIMILKRHRDMMYCNDEINCCPISIIITTLAAHSYDGEPTVAEALLTILENMDSYILERDGHAFIPNPSDPLENFADKWEKFPEREKAFHDWLAAARRDFGAAAQRSSRHAIHEELAKHIGEDLAERVEKRRGGSGMPLLREATTAGAVGTAAPAFGSTPRIPTKPQGFA